MPLDTARVPRAFRDRICDQLAWTRFRYKLRRRHTAEQRVIVLQSADRTYAPFLEVTGCANCRYAERMNHAYAQFIGNVGPRPMTANFNRYYLLREVAKHTYHQWALWMDADAIVVDPAVPLESIIDGDRDKLIIACAGHRWGDHDVNNGVFFFNLRHPETSRFLRYLIGAARHVRRDNARFHSDQQHFQAWLWRRRRADGSIACVKRYAGSSSRTFNYNGTFIQHALRRTGTFEQRLQRLQSLQRESESKLVAAQSR